MLQKKKNKSAIRYKWILLMLGVILLCGGVYLIRNMKKEEASTLLAQIKSYQGYTRVVSKEEQDFYSYFVERDLPHPLSEESFYLLLKEYINEVNAIFFLGNQIGLCEPYSFDLLKLRMEQENRNRQLQMEQGEVIYGVEQFTLENFYQYERETLESDIIAYLETNADESVLQMAEDYYETHEDLFQVRQLVVYEITEGGKTSLIEADRDQLDFLGNADRALADFLERAEVGDRYEEMETGTERCVEVKEIQYTERGFDQNRDYVLAYFLRNVFLDEVICLVAENNPVELL